MHDVPYGRIAVTKVQDRFIGYTTFSLAELYAEVLAELDKPQQLSLFGMLEEVAG